MALDKFTKKQQPLVEVMGPLEPELQVRGDYDGWFEVATGSQKDMETMGRRLKAQHPARDYRIRGPYCHITWRS